MHYTNVARTRTTADVFNAIGDEHRRKILDDVLVELQQEEDR